MGTNYIAPIWRQPENLNKDRLSNYSINFGGSDYIGCGTDLFTGSNISSISISVWVKTTTGSANAIISKDLASTGNRNFLLQLSGNDLYWQTSVDGNILQPITTSVNLLDGEWHHIVATYEAGSTSGTAEKKIYVDGQVEATDPAATLNNIVNTPSVPIEIARRGDDTRYYSGEISQVSIFDYALSTDQVTYLNNLGNPLVISGAEPIAYWPLGDNSNPTATAGYPNIVSAADSVFDFGTSNEEIDTPGPYTDGTQGDLTISAWVKQDSITTSYRPFICTGFTSSMTQPQIAMALRNVGGNRLYLFYNGGGGSNYIYAQNVMTEANRWYHCAFVRSGSTGKLYVDGQEVSTLNSADFSVSPQVTTADSEMTLGGWRYSGSNESLNGELSNVCLWKTALTDGVGGQIEELYNNGMPLLELSEIPQNNNLLGWYKLNQSAILTPGVPTNWTITKIGNPNYGSAVDGCYVADNSNSTPTIYNTGGLIWHDNDSGTTVGSDYFQWNSPIIYTSGSNIVLSSSGGSYLDPYYGSQAILEYNIDNGSWVTWHTQTNGPGGFSANSFSIPSTGNLTVSNNIQIRIKGVDRGSNGSFLRINDVNATGGTSSYSENFNSNTTKYGFFANSETQPPATFSADHWDIPDNRSPYPQSFNFDNALTTPAPSFDSYFNPDGYTKLTFSIWAYAENYYNRGTFFATFENTANKYSDSNFTISPSRNRFNVSINGDFICALNIGGAFQSITPNNVWNCITVVYDGTFTDADTATQNAGRLKFYTNGFYKAFDGFSNDVPSSIISNSLGSRIGAANPTQGNAALRSPFLGKLSNLQIWDTNLLASDALTLYNNGAPLPTASVEPSSLKAWYKLDNNDVWNPVLNQWEIIDYAN